MNTKRVQAAEGVLQAAMVAGRVTAAGLAVSLESACLLQSPESAAELEQLQARVDEVERKYTFDLAESRREADKLIRWHAEDAKAIARHVAGHRAARQRAVQFADQADAQRKRADSLAERVAQLESSALERAQAGLVRLAADVQAAPAVEACQACGSLPEDWCPDCAACRNGCFDGHENNLCTHPNAKWAKAGGVR